MTGYPQCPTTPISQPQKFPVNKNSCHSPYFPSSLIFPRPHSPHSASFLLKMANQTAPPKAMDEKSLHEDEEAKTTSDPMLAIYLEYAAQTPQWKAHHTSRLIRKVDVRLLPLLILMYLLNFLDRSNLAQARLGTLERDLGMRGTDFNLATSILFVVSSRLFL
jgi:hypothetical protein